MPENHSLIAKQEDTLRRCHHKWGKCCHLVAALKRCSVEVLFNTRGRRTLRLMSMQTGSTRGHHLANYHCWHIGADLNCHRKHITPCPNCPAICHRATRRAIQYREDGGNRRQPRDKATWSSPQTGQTAGPPASLSFGGHSTESQCH